MRGSGVTSTNMTITIMTMSAQQQPTEDAKPKRWVPAHLRKIQEEAKVNAAKPKPASKWVEPVNAPRQQSSTPYSSGNQYQGGGGGRFARDNGGRGASKVPNMAIERELFGEGVHGDKAHVTTGINFAEYDKIPVDASGRDVPEHCESFEETGLNERILTNVKLCGYHKPTPIQKYSLPIVIAGRDLMACAQTGSGKTAAFMLPVIHRVMTEGVKPAPQPKNSSSYSSRRRPAYPTILVVAPTRELATQIYDETKRFAYCTGLSPVVVYGGQDIRNQLREMERGCDIVIATPGRLCDMLQRGKLSLANIRFLILDEADRMLDMGFEPQIREIVDAFDMPSERQTMLFSATFPTEIQVLAQDFLEDYVFLTVGRIGSTNDFIIQKMVYTTEYDKRNHLMEILVQCEGLTLIFVETKRGCDMLEMHLIDSGVNAISLHGDRSQQEREYALDQFRKGHCPVLVATDVASRGLDIPNVLCVINYDLPQSIDHYVHRIGRTGRCGNKGDAYSFVTDKNHGLCSELYEVLKDSNQEIPGWFEDMSKSRYRGGGGGHRNKGGNRDMRRDRGYQQQQGGFRREAPAPAAQEPPRRAAGGGGRGFGGGDSWSAW